MNKIFVSFHIVIAILLTNFQCLIVLIPENIHVLEFVPAQKLPHLLRSSPFFL